MKSNTCKRSVQMVIVVVLTILCFTLVVSAAEVSKYAQLSAAAPYAQTARANSDSGNARINGATTNGVPAIFALLKYTSPNATAGVYSSGPLTAYGTGWGNYGALAYAGYIQQRDSSSHATGGVTVYTK